MVLNRGYGAKRSSESVFDTPLGFALRSLEGADTGTSSEYFEIIELNLRCSFEQDCGALQGGCLLSHQQEAGGKPESPSHFGCPHFLSTGSSCSASNINFHCSIKNAKPY